MKLTKKHWITYAIELILAIIFMSIGLEVFLIYAFIALVFALDRKVDYLRKLIRVLHLTNETKILAIVRKQKITDSELTKIGEEIKKSMTDKQIEDLEKDIRSLQGY